VPARSPPGRQPAAHALTNPFYDLQRYSLTVVSSPRHADMLLVTSAITTA
jgi:Ni,Fe-hydrogenase III small subunit